MSTVHEQWSEEKANSWYKKQPYLKGANYVPTNAVNQLEMWQAETFDPARIDLELGWAADMGMNTMRVFLHDLLWDQDPEGFKDRIDTFLGICQKHGIRPMIVLFDSVWDPEPKLGPQKEPTPGVHNPGWLQSPGKEKLCNPASYGQLKAYVKDIIGTFANDERILIWDLWNEPDNENESSYGRDNLKREPADKQAYVEKLLPQVFEWAREAGPSQPLTSGVWRGDWTSDEVLKPIFKAQLDLSDVISFHSYDPASQFVERIKSLQRYNRPMMCTEYMARNDKDAANTPASGYGGTGNTFGSILPLAEKFRVASYCWGFVEGKTQTNIPWDSWQNPYVNGRTPAIWFHDVLKKDGTPYKQEEVGVIRKTGTAPGPR